MFPSFFTAIAPTEIYTLSLHDALPILKVVAPYLDSSDIERIREAYKLADEAHLGQFRSSGEPYITHPIAVAAICGGWKLDAERSEERRVGKECSAKRPGPLSREDR